MEIIPAKFYRFAYKFTHNIEDAQDLVQETFLHIYKSKTFNGELITSYFYTIMRNLFYDKLRYKTAHTISKESKQIESFKNINELPQELTIQNLEAEINIKLTIDNILNAATKEEKKMMLMYMEGYTFADIAAKMDIKLKTVQYSIRKYGKKTKNLVTS